MSKVDLTWDEEASKKMAEALAKHGSKVDEAPKEFAEEIMETKYNPDKFKQTDEQKDKEDAVDASFDEVMKGKIAEIAGKIREKGLTPSKKTTDEFKMEPVDLSDMKLDKRDYMDKKKIMKVSEDIEM